MSKATEIQPRRLAPPDISLRGLIRLASPLFVANMAVMGNVTIDTIMAGRMGAEHLAAIALGGASTACLNMLLIGIIQGLSPICGHHFGARKFELIGYEINQAFYIVCLLSLLGAPILAWTGLWTSLGQVTGNIARIASLYLLFSAIALPFALISRVFISVNAAINRARTTMWVSLLVLALKAPVNAVFMYGLFGLPALGGAGAGLANAVLVFASALLYLMIFCKDPACRKMRAQRLSGPDLRAMGAQLRIGLPIGLSVFFEVSSFTLMAIFISRLGATAISAHQIVSNITSTLYMVPLSIGIASSVLVAQSLGSGHPEAAEEMTHRALRFTILAAAAASALLYCFKGEVIGIYTHEGSVAALAQTLILCGVIYHTFDATQSVSSFILRGYKIAWVPMVVSGLSLWCLGLGGGYYLGFCGSPLGGPMGALGFWIACSAGLILAALCLAGFALAHARSITRLNARS